jgi:EmrB/QacA subfamily drug resistance transporter
MARCAASAQPLPEPAVTAATAGPCDRGIAHAVGAPVATNAAHPTGTLAATILGSSLAFIDGSVVNVGLPAIERGLGADGASISWLINAYLLPLGALVLFGGVAGDRWGRKRTFLGGLLVFVIASIGCALAPSFALLLVARVVQGMGAAFLMPASLALLGAAFNGEARGRAVGTWAAAGAVTGAIGPLLGGWLIDGLGWRSIFLINVPIAVAAGALAWSFVDESRSGEPAPLDLGGALLATAGLALLTAGLTELAGSGGASAAAAAPRASATATAAAALATGGALLLAFVGFEARLGARAIMPLTLFGTKSFVGITLLTLFLYAALGGMVVLLPYVLIEKGGYSAAAAGAALLPLPIAMGLGSRAAGRLAERTGARLLLSVGPCIAAAGFALFLRIDDDAYGYLGVVLPALAIVACGLTLSVAPLTAAVMGAVDATHVGSASGVNNAVARVAGLLATALLGLVLASGPASAGFMARFHVAALVGAVLALAAGVAALVTLAPPRRTNST